jgi:hypothetical protein
MCCAVPRFRLQGRLTVLSISIADRRRPSSVGGIASPSLSVQIVRSQKTVGVANATASNTRKQLERAGQVFKKNTRLSSSGRATRLPSRR